MPDGDAALEGLTGFLARFCKILNPVFDGIRKTRDASSCLYDGRTFIWSYLVGFLMRMGSRNAMDANRNDPNYADAILKLADQKDWPDGLERRAPSSQQGCNYLKRGCTAVLEKALVDIVCHMIRLKLFDGARFRGLFVIAVDGTKQERIRCCKWLGNRANRYVLEAKLITPWGSAFSVMSVPIKPWHDRNEDEKQDSEYHGFLRLAPLLKEAFPNLGICILGDSLYACAPLMKVCEDYGWEYIFTFKEGRTPSAYAEAQKLMAADPGNAGRLVRHDPTGKRVDCGMLSWATNVEIVRGAGEWQVFNVVRVSETGANGSPYAGQFATSIGVGNLKDADDVCKWGRRRWDIESSFHVEKNGGYGLGHNFCNHSRVSRNIYLIMQIAHNLWQLFNLGVLLPLQKRSGNRNMTQRKWVGILLQKLIAKGISLALDELPRRYISREFLTL